MKNKAISALMIMSILAGCFVPQSIAFADDDTQTTEGQTDNTDQSSDGDQGTDNTGDEDKDPESTEEELISDPATAGDGYGSGNNNNSTVVTDPGTNNPVQGMTPAGPESSDVTYIPGEMASSVDAVRPSSSEEQQVHVSKTTYSTDDSNVDLAAIDERAENGSNDEDTGSIEVPHTGEDDGINMLAVGLLAIAGITVVAAAAVVVLMNKLAKRAEVELK